MILTSYILIAPTLRSHANDSLIISQYTEGSGYFKAVELFNSGHTDIRLEDYKLVKYQNGSTFITQDIELQTDVIIPPGDTWVIVSSNASSSDTQEALLIEKANQFDANLNHNGDDPYALIEKNTGNVVDFFGQYGDVDFAKDTGYERINLTSLSDGQWDITYWQEVEKDSASGFGEKPTQGGTPTPPEEPEVFTCGQISPIYALQGESSISPLLSDGIDGNEFVYTTGIITSILKEYSNGFYIQDSQGDNNVKTSDGIFVYTGASTLNTIKKGDEICIYGEVIEYYNQTEIAIDPNDIHIISRGNTLAPTQLQLSNTLNNTNMSPPRHLHDQLEAYEGMFVTTNHSGLVVSRPFSFDYQSFRYNMALSFLEPIYKSTQLYTAGSKRQIEQEEKNTYATLIIESDIKAPNGVIPYFSDFNPTDGYIRLSDTINNLSGVISYDYAQYRLIVSDDVNLDKTDFDHSANPRPDPTQNNTESSLTTFLDTRKQPHNKHTTAHHQSHKHHDELKVASFNVLNLFNSPFGGNDNPLQQNRGAKSLTQYALQLNKISHAILALDADIIGLMEIENNGFDPNSAIFELTQAINQKVVERFGAEHDGRYQFIDARKSPRRTLHPINNTPYNNEDVDFERLGSDAIMVGFIYRQDRVAPQEKPRRIALPEQHGTDTQGLTFDKYHRVSLMQEFKHLHTSKKLNVVVNHLKSKGTGCIDDSGKAPNIQGNCSAFRVSASMILGEYLKKVKGNILILGDLNAYGEEDPIRVLTNYNTCKADKNITGNTITNNTTNNHQATENAHQTIVTAEQTYLQGEPLHTSPVAIKRSYGYTNLNSYFNGKKNYTYRFDGELGALDHALANTSLLPYVNAAYSWHINSAESDLFQYSSQYTGDLIKSDNEFSSSDHDPVLVHINLKIKKVRPKKPENSCRSNQKFK